VLTLSLVRHGQTEYNAASLLQGWTDSPLTRNGLGRVRLTAAYLADHPFAAAYVSPSGRAQATAAEILAKHPSLRAVTDPDLREFCFGELEARPEAELAHRYNMETLFEEVVRGRFAGIAGGGEQGPTFVARVQSAFERIEAMHRDGHVVVVSHGLTLRTYLAMVDPRPIAALPNASVSTVQVDADGCRRVLSVALEPGAVSLAGHRSRARSRQTAQLGSAGLRSWAEQSA